MADPGLKDALILVVDDNPANLDLICSILGQQQCRVAAATSGQQALGLAVKIRPDLILLDVMMPGMDGVETCRAFKQQADFASIPVIFVTANVQEMSSAFQVGGVDYILKPINQEELLARMKTHLALYRHQNQLEELVSQRTRDLHLAHERLQQASQAKSAFMSRVSHELRTPMNGILGMTELLQGGNPREDQQGHLDALSHSAARMMTLVDQLLDFTVMEEDTIALRREPLDLRVVVNLAVQAYATMAADAGLELTLDFGPEVPVGLIGDAEHLQQILNNLLSNAIRFAGQGQVKVRAHAGEAADETALITIEIHDSGPGVPAQQRSRILEDFAQIDESLTRQQEGLGLGLAIVTRLVRAMGGELEVGTSELGGALFAFSMPFARAQLDTTELAATTEAGVFENCRVLVVDDNRINRVYAVRLLEKLGCKPAEACDGEAALKVLREQAFDLVLMDIHMPSRDGYQTTRELRAGDGANAEVPVIAVTADEQAATRERCRGAGMQGFLAKPLRLADLEAMMTRCLQDHLPTG